MGEERLGDAPIEKAYRAKVQAMAKELDAYFNGAATGTDRKIGFILLVFPFGEAGTGRCNYISNGADRKEVVIMLKEQIARFEGQPEIKGSA